jgi:hypothetical protein
VLQIVYTAESVAAYFVVAYWKGFANNGITPAQRQVLRENPDSPEWALRVNGSKTHVIGLLLYMTLLWLLKGYWVIYYLRLTEGVASAKRYARWGTVIIPVTYVSCFLVAFLKCIPFEKQWQIDPEPQSASSNHSHSSSLTICVDSCLPAISYLQTIYVMAMNTATDFFLMSIPLPVSISIPMPLVATSTDSSDLDDLEGQDALAQEGRYHVYVQWRAFRDGIRNLESCVSL